MAFALKGSASGSTLVIAAGLAGFSVAAPSEGGGGSDLGQRVTISTLHRSNQQVAPETVVLEAVATGFPGVSAPTGGDIHDDTMMEIDYVWDFGQSGATFDYAEATEIAFLSNANTAIGKIVDPTFPTAGTYTVTCTAIKWSSATSELLSWTATTDITVADVNSVYTQIAFVDPDGDYTGSPATGGLNFTSLAAAVDAIELQGTQTNTQVLFRAGKTSTTAGGQPWESGCGSLYFATHGAGAKHVIDLSAFTSSVFFMQRYDPSQNKDFVWTNLRLEGGWDETTETGPRKLGWQIGGTDQAANYWLWYDCEIEGFNAIVSSAFTTVAPSGYSMHIQNCGFYSKSDFPVIGTYEFATFSGNRDIRAANALGGGPKSDATDQNEHSSYRVTASYTITRRNDLMSCSGWTFQGGGTYLGNQMYVPQPPLRLNTECANGAYYNCTENVVEGGYQAIAFDSSNNNGYNPINYQIERNIIVGSWKTQVAISTGFTGGRIVNNVFIVPDIDYTVGGAVTDQSNPSHFIRRDFAYLDNANPTENANGRLIVKNNTVVNRSNISITMVDTSLSSVYTVETGNTNLNHGPSAGGTDWDISTTNVFGARKTADWDWGNTAVVPNTATPLATPTLGVPNGTSAAVNGVTGGELATVYDLLGNQRSVPDDIGANVA